MYGNNVGQVEVIISLMQMRTYKARTTKIENQLQNQERK